METAVKRIEEKLTAQFGQEVKVKYVDTSNRLSDFPEVSKVALAGYSFPITLVNGEPRLAGDLLYEDLEEIIKEEQKA